MVEFMFWLHMVQLYAAVAFPSFLPLFSLNRAETLDEPILREIATVDAEQVYLPNRPSYKEGTLICLVVIKFNYLLWKVVSHSTLASAMFWFAKVGFRGYHAPSPLECPPHHANLKHSKYLKIQLVLIFSLFLLTNQ